MKTLKWIASVLGIAVFLNLIFWGGFLYGKSVYNNIDYNIINTTNNSAFRYGGIWGYSGDFQYGNETPIKWIHKDNTTTTNITITWVTDNFSISSANLTTGYLSKPTWLPEWLYDLMNNNHDIFINYSTANNSAGWDYGIRRFKR